MLSSDGAGMPAYVARVVIGNIKTTKHKINTATKNKPAEIEAVEATVEDPIIVFFSSGNSQVFPLKVAQSKGFLQTPEVLNADEVKERNHPAFKYRMAINHHDRIKAWIDLEEMVINNCLMKCGAPLSEGASYSDKSMYLDSPVQSSLNLE
jgi:hypothetical protein